MRYYPFAGLFKLYLSDHPTDKLNRMRKFYVDLRREGVDLAVINTPNKKWCNILPVSAKLIKQISLEQGKVTSRVNVINNFNLGLIDNDSPEWARRRTVFSKFFDHSNLRSLIPKIA